MTPPATPGATRSDDQEGQVSDDRRGPSLATDAPRPADRNQAPPGPRELLRRARLRVLHGDRPYVVVFLAATGLALVIVSGPVQTWMGQRALVDQREAVLSVLEAENERLAARVEDLNDPGTIEAEAREQQGMVRPGEVPYVIVPPDVDAERIAPDLTDVETDDRGWLARAWEAITGLVE